MDKFPIFEAFLTDDEELLGIALVKDPAIKMDFLCFSEDKITEKLFFNEDKMIVKGPALIPNQLIFRDDIPGGRYIYFSEETVVGFYEKLMAKKGGLINLEHTKRKANAKLLDGFLSTVPNEYAVPKNSIILELKIDDANTWADIKLDKYNGFSIQDRFVTELISLSNQKNSETNMTDEVKNKLFNAINSILFGEQVNLAADVTAPSGDTVDVTAPIVDTVSGDTTEPVVTPAVSGDTEDLVPPTSGDTTDPVVEPLDENKIKEMISESQSETVNQLKVLIEELSAKIEAYGNTPEVAPAPVTSTIDNKAALVTSDNPYAKFFPQNK